MSVQIMRDYKVDWLPYIKERRREKQLGWGLAICVLLVLTSIILYV